MGVEGLPYSVVCIVGGPAPSHIIIGGADDKLKRKPSLGPSSRPVVVLFLFLVHLCYFQISCLGVLQLIPRHNEHKHACYRVPILFRIESRNVHTLSN